MDTTDQGVMDISLHEDQETIREAIRGCQRIGHVQQVAYNTYHDALTQVCWTERVVRTSAADLVEAAS